MAAPIGNVNNFKIYGKSGLSVLDSAFHHSGANLFFAAMSGMEMVNSALSTPVNTVESFWETGTGFGALGQGVGQTVGGAFATGGAAWWAGHAARRLGQAEAFAMKGGFVYGALKDGSMQRLSGAGKPVIFKNPKAVNAIKKLGVSGVYKNGKFLKHAGLLKGMAGMVALSLAPVVLGAAGSAIGGVMDEMMSEHLNRGKYTYDTRYFAGQAKYDNGYYDQLGQLNSGTNKRVVDAMQSYSSKMMSVARIYHSR